MFAGIDLIGGAAWGASSTTNGGAPFAGGSVVDNVKFGLAAGLGGHIGYQLDGPLSLFVSYQHSNGGVGWDAEFPLFGVSSSFDGSATSNALLANLAYDISLSSLTSIKATVGAGATINTLSSVVETDSSGAYLANLADHSVLSPTAQVGLGVQHKITDNAALGLGASIAYGGGFETGASRHGNLGTTAINPYRIDDVWRASANASLRFQF